MARARWGAIRILVLGFSLLVSCVAFDMNDRAAAQSTVAQPQYGLASKRPVLQAACRYCPWGALGDVVKKAMSFYGYDVAICYACSGEDGARIVSRRLTPPEVTDRQFAEGTGLQPQAPIDFGVTNAENVRRAYEGKEAYQKDGPMANLRVIARIESPAYLMVAAVRSSGITDLHQIAEKKMPVRIMAGVAGGLGNIDVVLRHYGFSRQDVLSWGGKILAGNALLRNPDFDVIIGVGVLANYPEGGMWYEMTQRKDLTFFPIPEELRQKLVRENGAVLVDLPFRYMRGVGDTAIPTVGFSGIDVYGRDDLSDAFVYDVAKALDEKRDLIRWTGQPFSYDPMTVANGSGVPLHPAAAEYYRERGYPVDAMQATK
ncbi:MAG TPA: TAXI family TRAP transporter solute-binding subunit [Xanthobacteraceae bacterium]|nr:TAXI family TRAP transporter solute-binding subunit [Xanthobacteraceae bacterium]